MLIPGICTQCGATLSVEKEKDAMLCPYCNTPFVVEKAIQKYSIVNNINSQNVYVQGSVEKEYKVESGVLTKYSGKSEHVKIPQGVKKIGDNAFEGLMIESVELCDGVIDIGSFAFRNCKRLKSFTFPASLQTMGCHPFYACGNLESIYVSSESLGKVVFDFGTIYTSWNEEPCDGRLVDECKKLVNIYVDGEKLQTNDSRLKYFASTPIGFSLFLNKRRIEREAKEREERQRIETQRKTNNLCLHCGGRFEGFFIKKCGRCKRVKDY